MVFDKYIKEKVSNYEYWLLLVNRHCIYVNLDFFDYIDKHWIIVLVL